MNKTITALQRSWPFFLGLVLGLYFITLNITGKNFTDFTGDLGDGRFTNYLLEHSYQFFTGQKPSFWNADFMAPEPDVITYSENMVGTAPFYAVFRLGGLDRETAFQAWYLVIVILNYTACYFFLRKCFKNNYVAVLGAMVFAFSMALQSQMTHPQTFPRFAIPLAFWMGFLFLEKLRPLYFFAALFFVVYQLYCCIYTGLMLAVPMALLLLFTFIYNRRLLPEKLKNYKWLGAMALSVIINVLIVLPLMLPYQQRSKQVGLNQFENILWNIPGLRSHFFSQPGSLFWDFLSTTGSKLPAYWDHQIFAGGIATISLLLFSILVIMRMINKKIFPKIPVDGAVKILFFTGLICFLLFIRIGEFSLYKFIIKLPGFASMRAIQRIINIDLIFFSFATAFIFSILLKKKNMLAILLFLVFAGLITLDNYYKKGKSYTSAKVISQTRIDSLMIKMKDIPAGGLVSYEPLNADNQKFVYQVDAMLAAQALHLRTVNGYTGTSPSGYGRYWVEMNKDSREEWFRAMNFKPDTVYIVN